MDKISATIEHCEPQYLNVSIEGPGVEGFSENDVVKAMASSSYQDRVSKWLEHCFGESNDPLRRESRAHRFVEESLEFAQSVGTSKEDALALVEYVFSRPVGDPAQEVGGVMLTLAGAASENGLDVTKCAEDELARVWTKVDAIRAKKSRQVAGSPLPGTSEPEPVDPKTGRPFGDYGTYEDAVKFMLSPYCVSFERSEFISDWSEGNLRSWPEFFDYLKKESGK